MLPADSPVFARQIVLCAFRGSIAIITSIQARPLLPSRDLTFAAKPEPCPQL
jgi:hypothetical protein